MEEEKQAKENKTQTNAEEKVTKALNRASGFIRGKLFDMVEISTMPELSFAYDESIEYGSKIEKIIDSINKEEE